MPRCSVHAQDFFLNGLLFGFVSEPDGLLIVPLCALFVALGAAREATVVVGEGIVWREPDGLGVILQRAFHIALREACAAPRIVGVGRVGPEPYRAVAVLEGTFDIALG